jgi:hypothetical protein
MGNNIGRTAYMILVFGAILLGLLNGLTIDLGDPMMWVWVLVIAGLVVGFFNATGKATTDFLIIVIALPLLAGSIAVLPSIGTINIGGVVESIAENLVTGLAPAGLVIALSTIIRRKM